MDVLRDILKKHQLLEPGNIGDASVSLIFETLDVSGELESSVSCLMGIIAKEPRP
jgi:hypothetical protein